VLHRSQCSVSRQIHALEASLNTPLFHRHARGLILTEQGDTLFETVHEVFARLATAEAMIAESKEKPYGTLKVTTTVAFGSFWLTQRICEFVDRYPDIRLELLLSDSRLDLAMREADVAIRMTAPGQPDLIQRHLFTVHTHVFAAPCYLERFGEPKTLDDLRHHRLLVFANETLAPVPTVNWLLTAGMPLGERRSGLSTISINLIYAIARAVQAGVVIAALPDYMAAGLDGLVRVLPDMEGPETETYFVYPEEMRRSKRIGVFRDFLLELVASNRF